MVTLPGFPHITQLDGTENERMNCVPTSAAACIDYLNPGANASADILKDAEYGPYYQGGTSFARFHDDNADLMVSRYDCDAEAFSSSDLAALVARVHTWLQQGYPVIATIPSAWGTVYSQAQRQGGVSSHVVAFYGETANGGLVAMNPWGGFDQLQSDSWWASRLCFNQVWRVYRIGGSMLLPLSAVSAWFTLSPDGQVWKCNQTGQVVGFAILNFYRSLGTPPNGLPMPGLPVAPETGLTPSPCTFQRFERAVLVYDPNHALDSQPGYGPVYFGKLTDPRFGVAGGGGVPQTTVDDLQARLAAAQATATSAQDALATAQTDLFTAQTQRDAAYAAAATAQATAATAQSLLTALKAFLSLS